MSGGELRREHGTEGESLSVVGGVSDLNHVGFGIVGQRVDARHLSFADGIDAEFVRGAVFASAHRSVGISHFSLCPAAFAVKTGADLLGECDGCSARRVQFVDVMCFHFADVVVRIGVHDARQILVHGREDGDAE